MKLIGTLLLLALASTAHANLPEYCKVEEWQGTEFRGLQTLEFDGTSTDAQILRTRTITGLQVSFIVDEGAFSNNVGEDMKPALVVTAKVTDEESGVEWTSQVFFRKNPPADPLPANVADFYFKRKNKTADKIKIDCEAHSTTVSAK